jgi:hypothetical protein
VQHPLRALTVSGAALILLAGLGTGANAAARTTPARTTPPAILHVGQIDQQDVPSRGSCQPDTLVEPDVAVSPFNANIQVAVAHDCRFADGGAVDISYAWTHDGGATWHHAPVPGLTRAVDGFWDRASDPVVAFGADGSVYISSLVFNVGCPSAVAVSRSTDGGATFGPPVLAHKSGKCSVSDDKNWIVADTNLGSPFYGRVYQFWTEFLRTGSPQVVRWSDDQGKHWSNTVVLGSPTENAQDSQLIIQPDGAITDVYNFSSGGRIGGDVPAAIIAHDAARPAAAGSGISIVARTSFDGGATWSARSVVTRNIGGGPIGIRCCLPLASGDPKTGRMFTVWNANGPGTQDAVMLSSSADGRHWSAPVQVTHGNNPNIQYINAAVAAGNGKVFVSYGVINTAVASGNLVQQELTWSTNGGASFGSPIALGRVSNLKYSAISRGHFPGDYTGLSLTPTKLTAAWCLSFKPANPNLPFNQVLYAATLRP